MKRYLPVIIATVLLLQECKVQKPAVPESKYLREDITNFHKQISWVNDFENVLSGDQKNVLDSICGAYEKRTSNQVCIVTVSSIDPYEYIGNFAQDLGNYWGIGIKGKDNGLIITYSKTRREVWIGVGSGIEEILPNELIGNIIAEIMVPHFKDGNTYKGILAGLNKVIEIWDSK